MDWKLRPLIDLINIQSGFAFKSEEYTDSGHFLVRIGNVQDGFLSLDNPKYVGLDRNTARFDLQEGDILTSLTGNIGRVAMVESSHLPVALNQRVARLTPKNSAVLDRGYLFLFLSSDFFKKSLSSIGHGAAQQNVSPKAIGDIEIPLPPLPEQGRIVARLDALSAETQRLESVYRQKLACLAELKQAILQKAFSGELGAQPDKALKKAFA